MERKENDLFLNMVANPSFQLEDFATIGFTTDNTSLQEDKNVYKNNELIQKKFTDDEGKFDNKKFDDAYNKALINYNAMSLEAYNKASIEQVSYHRDNIFAPEDQRRKGPDFQRVVVPNPDRISSSMYRLGEMGERTKSRDELAQASRVLLNPAEVARGKEAKWGKSVNDGFFDYFTDTFVMAAWDEDGTHIDPITGQEVQHQKGEFKIGEDGTYYYEKLDGRDIYGKQVLNKMNILTTDGSKWNKYDFFDSDDINQKSVGGTIMKQAALVGTMFLPYVGPVIAGLSVASQLIGLTGTLGKMLTGSDSPTFSALEGFSKSWNRQTAKTEYAQENTWCWENFITLIGDVAAQLKEQRFVFEQVPAVFKGKYINSEKQMKALSDEFASINNNKVKNQLKEIAKKEKESWAGENILAAKRDLYQNAAVQAVADLNSWKKGYQKIGEVLSKGYMTAITVGDTYGEAKAAGASDLDATLLTLGYAAGEAAILNTGIGEWILPELRADKYKNQAIIKALKKLEDDAEKGLKDFRSLSGITDKKEYAKKLFGIGKDIARATYATGARTVKATAAAGLGEGIEEVSEELLADFSKGCYNTVNWLRGNDVRMDSFGYSWEDGERSWDSKDLFDRYSMSFVGGLAGGALTNALTSFKQIKSYDNMSKESAIQEVVYMAREGKLGELIKTMDKMDLAEKNISATEFETVNGKPVPKASDYAGSRDAAIKTALRQQFSIIENILKANNAHLSDKSFLEKNTLNDLRFAALQKAVTSGLFMERYNSLASELVRLTLEINRRESKDTNKDGIESDKEKKTQQIIDDTYKEKKARLKEVQKELKDFAEGKMAYKFIQTTLFELSSSLSGNFLPVSFPLYAEYITKKKYSEISKEDLERLKQKYSDWKGRGDAKNRIYDAAQIFAKVVEQSSNTIKSSEDVFRNQDKLVQDITKTISRFSSLIANVDISDPNIDVQTFYEEVVRNNSGLTLAEGLNINEDVVESLLDTYKIKLETLKTITDPVQRKLQLEDIKKEYYDSIQNLLVDNAQKYFQKFIDQGFATKAVKQQLVNIKKEVNLILSSKVNMDDNEGMRAMHARQNTLDDMVTTIQELPSSPFEKNLDDFITSIGETPIKFSELVEKVNLALTQSKDNLPDFALDDPIIKELDYAISLVEMYRASVLGARTDALNQNDLFSYNATLNEVSAKVGEATNFAEIDSQLADIMVADIETNLHTLKSLRNLHSLNQGQKMNTQQKVGTKKDALIYKEIKRIIDIPDNDELRTWKDFDKLKEIANLPTLTRLENASSYILGDEELIELEKEKIQMANAIYEFFNANLDKFSSPKTSKAFFFKFDLYTNSPEILHESMTQIGDLNILSYITALTAIKYEDFLTAYKGILDPTQKIAPVPSQEMSVFINTANTLNGNIFDTFINAHRDYIKYDWTKVKDIEARKIALSKLNPEFKQESLDAFSSNENAEFCFNFLTCVPRYTNITLINGMPGTGKTDAVIRQILKVLAKSDSEITKKIAIVHGVAKTSAEALKNNLELSKESTAQDKEEFLKRIIPNYTPFIYDEFGVCQVDKSNYYLNKQNEIVGKWEYNTSKNDIPSLIIIDEISRFNQYEVDAINEYAQKMGISVIAAGDFDQSGVVGEHPITYGNINSGGNMQVNCRAPMFYSSPKLGVSMRSGITMIANDVLAAQRFFRICGEDFNEQLTLHANWGSGKLYGNFVNGSDNFGEIASGQNFGLSIEQQINAMISDLQPNEKIGFIYTDTNSGLYQYIDQPGIREHFDFKGNSAQGLEGRYYVTDLSYETKDSDEFYTDENIQKYLYTAMSRASTANIIVLPEHIYGSSRITTDKQEALVVPQTLTQDTIARFTSQRLKVLEETAKGNQLKYTKRGQSIVEEPKVVNGEIKIGDVTYKVNTILKSKNQQGQDIFWKILSITDDQVQIDNILRSNNTYVTSGNIVTRTVEQFIKAIQDGNLEEGQLPSSTQVDTSVEQHTINGIVYKRGDKFTFDSKPVEIKQLYKYSVDIVDSEGNKHNLRWTIFENYIRWGRLKPITQQLPSTQDIQDFADSVKNDDIISVSGAAIGMSGDVLLKVTNKTDSGIEYTILGSTNSGTIDFVTLVNFNAAVILQEDPIQDTSEDPISEDFWLIEDNPIESAVETESEVEKRVDENNDDTKKINNEKVSNPTSVKLRMHGYSFNTLALGTLRGQNGEIIWSENSESRIDGANGLRKIAKITTGSYNQNAEQALEDIGYYQSIILSSTNKEDLNSLLRESFDITDLNIRFDFKITATKSDGTEYFYKERTEKNSEAYALQHNAKESIQYIRGTDGELPIVKKQIVAIINSVEYGDVLEIPLLSLTNAFTFLQQKNGGQLIFKDFINAYNSTNPNLPLNYDGKPVENMHSTAEAIEKFLKNYVQSNPEYKNLLNLFKLFNYDNFGLISIESILGDNFLPSTYFDNLGMRFTTNKTNYDILDGRKFNKEYLDIEEYAQDPRIDVSEIVYSKQDLVGKEVTIKAGHPFVLISNDPSLTTIEDKLNQWQDQQKDSYNGVKSVRIMYITMPKASVEQWLEQLHSLIFSKERKGKNLIGNQYTVLKIIEALWNDPEGKQMILNQFPYEGHPEYIEKNINNILDTVNSLKGKKDELRNYLFSPNTPTGPVSNKKINQLTFLSQLLHIVAYKTNISGPGYNTLQSRVVRKIEEVLGDNKIYYHAVGDEDASNGLVKIYQEKGWKIDGKPARINGKVDTYEFSGDMTDLINGIASKIKTKRDGRKFIDLKEEVYRKPRQTQLKPSEYYNKYLELIRKFGLDDYLRLTIEGQAVYNEADLKASTKRICNEVNNKGGKLALVFNGIPKIITYKEIFEGTSKVEIYSNDNQRIVNIQSDNQGEYSFYIKVFTDQGEEIYDAKITNDKLFLTPKPIQQTETSQQIPSAEISIDVIKEKLDNFKYEERAKNLLKNYINKQSELGKNWETILRSLRGMKNFKVVVDEFLAQNSELNINQETRRDESVCNPTHEIDI